MKIGLITPYFTPDTKTKELLARCKESVDERFIHIILEDDGSGVSNTRNRCLNIALDGGCDYITFLDADDTLKPDAYDQVLKAIEEEPYADMIQMNHLRQRENDAPYCKFYNRKGNYKLDNLPQLWAVVWNKVYKASLIKHILFDEELCHGEDELFNLECLARARKIYCSERIAVIHHFDNPYSLSKSVEINDLVFEQNALMEFLYENQEDEMLCLAVANRQRELWSNPTYKDTIG